MNITELRYLVAIMKWGSVSAAAKQMYAAQPNVSIIGTALAALGNNGGGCGCGNNGILGGLFGGNNGSCCAMQQAEQAKTLAMVQGQQADNLSWANRVQSMQDDIEVYSYLNSRDLATNTRIGMKYRYLLTKSGMIEFKTLRIRAECMLIYLLETTHRI